MNADDSIDSARMLEQAEAACETLAKMVSAFYLACLFQGIPAEVAATLADTFLRETLIKMK